MKILYVTTLSLTINSFLIPHIRMLIKEGHHVDLACNVDVPIRCDLINLGCKVNTLPFSRSPLSINNMNAYKQLKRVISEDNYDIIHCHTPIAAACTRIACRKARVKGTKVIYTAHGFHFYKGAPLKNWLIYYPIEKLCSRWTDVLITINREDYQRALRKMHAGQVEYVPGVGVDVVKYVNTIVDKLEKRREIGVAENAFLLLSVGELNTNKNHEVVIRAIAILNNSNIHYVIAGKGDLQDYLMELAKELGISEQLHLIGYRQDVAELYKISDVFVFPSLREGLPVSVMEAMASGLPIICSKIRGNSDLVQNGKGGLLFNPKQWRELAEMIQELIDDAEKRSLMKKYNLESVNNFSTANVNAIMNMIYREI